MKHIEILKARIEHWEEMEKKSTSDRDYEENHIVKLELKSILREMLESCE